MSSFARNAAFITAAMVVTASCGSDCEVTALGVKDYPTSATVNQTVVFTGAVTYDVSECPETLTMNLVMPDGSAMDLRPSVVSCGFGELRFSIGITPTQVGAHQFEIWGNYGGNPDGACDETSKASGSFAVST